MKHLKLGFIAIALIGGFSAFAGATADDADDCTSQNQINTECNGSSVDCCTVRQAGFVFPNTSTEIPVGITLQKAL